jgi:hypothetical protein
MMIEITTFDQLYPLKLNVMKKIPLYLGALCIFLAFSCKKSNSGGNGSPANYYLSSVVSYSPQLKIIDSFSYDSVHRVDSFIQTIYDTTSGTPQYNTFTAQFIYQSATAYPSGYNYYDVPLGNYGDYHILSYDPDNRVIKDTSLSGSGYVTWYSYPNNNIAATVLFEGTAENNQIDTLFLTNGNISGAAYYTSDVPGQPDQQQADVRYSYAPTANPAYHAAISNSIGPLLTTLDVDGFGGFVDFISKNAYKQVVGVQQTTPLSFSYIYNLTTDSKGRLSTYTGNASGSSATIVFSYY